MLQRLRRQFIVIVMGLVGTVLVAVLGSTFVTSCLTQADLIESSLQRTLYGGLSGRPLALRDEQGGSVGKADGARMLGGLMGVLVDVGEDSIVLQMSDSPLSVDSQMIETVIRRVVEEGESEGTNHDEHVAWVSVVPEEYGDGIESLVDLDEDDTVVRIAIVDIASSDAILRKQALRDLEIIVVALVVLFAISWWLSDWALRPVEHAWEQQRRFVADASHELKTPLAVIMANLQILEADETIVDDARQWVQSSIDEAERMRSLVGDLLQLARADETAAGVSQNAMHHEQVDLSELVESAALEFDAIAFERGCTIEDEVAEHITVSADREWIDRLVRILIDNACKYAARQSAVLVQLTKSSGHAELRIHNEGNPIDPEDLPHVFERFYRSDKARSREAEGGFGLGLAIAKGIVDAHNGTISVSSSADEGTTFAVVLQAVAAKADQAH